MDLTPTTTPDISTPPSTPQHPLFYLPFINHPFLQMPKATSPHSVVSPSRNGSSTQRHQSTAWTVPMISSTTQPSASVTSSQQQSSNFSINKILEGSSIPPDILSHMTGPQSKALQTTTGFSIPPEPRALLDTAKMFWLHQLACSQTNHLSPGPSSGDHKIRVTKKRKLGRNPRIPFTQQQIDRLERKYTGSRYLSSLDVAALSKELDLSEPRVKIWFQNRRARERRDKRISLSHLNSEQAPASMSPPDRMSAVQSSPHRLTSVTSAQPMWSPTTELGIATSSINGNFLPAHQQQDNSTDLRMNNSGEAVSSGSSSSSIIQTSSMFISKANAVDDDS